VIKKHNKNSQDLDGVTWEMDQMQKLVDKMDVGVKDMQTTVGRA
jgi:hypothetical protein